MNILKIGGISVGIVASIAITLAIHQRVQSRLRVQEEAAQQQAGQLAELAASNERLSNLVSQMKTTRPLSEDQLRELMRLRSEVGQLRRTGTEKAQLQATNAELRTAAAKADKQLAEAQAAPNYWPKDQLAYAGYGDPESAMKSMLVAMNNGDVSFWRESCTPEMVAQMEKERQSHGISEAQQEAEIKAVGQALVATSVGFHIVDKMSPSPDETVVKLSFDGEGKTREFVLKKIGYEWKVKQVLLAGQDEP